MELDHIKYINNRNIFDDSLHKMQTMEYPIILKACTHIN